MSAKHATRGSPGSDGALLGRAMQAHRAGDTVTAQTLYARVLQASPRVFAALYALGVSYCQQGQQARGVPFLEQALSVEPDYAEAHSNLASALNALKHHEKAITHAERAVALDPASAEAYSILGDALHALARHDEAIARYEQALAVKPAYTEVYWNLGNALHALARYDEAIARYEQAVALRPDFAEAHNNLGGTLNALGRHDEAVACYERAVALKPAYTDAHHNLGKTFQALGRQDEAIVRYEQALALKPAFAEAYFNLGNALHGLGRHDEAIARYEQALTVTPAYADAHFNLGNALQALNRADEALPHYEQALALKPDFAAAEAGVSFALLAAGRLPEGWPPYEARLRANDGVDLPDLPRRRWCGQEDLAGKTILLRAEQGLGDTIQFCRYAALVARQGARVILEVQPALRTLLADIQGPNQIVALGDPLPDYDLHCPLLSLPLAFRTRLDTIPAAVPYLTAKHDLIAKWTAALGAEARPRIGIAWSGSPNYRKDRQRSIPLHRLVPLLTAGVSLVSLHNEVRTEDQEVLDAHPELLHFGAELTAFADMAALITQLDLVISVDTSVAHLAGALNKPVWVLLPFASDWRWMRDRTDSPWYPTARLFRQPRIGDWDSVIRIVGEHLASFGK